MSNNAPYGRAGFRLILDVNGTEYEISQYDSEFALNAIPQAQCMLAVGREVRSLKPAAVHRTGHQLAIMKKAEVFIEAKGAFSPTKEWPEGRRKIFSGYLTGQGYRRSNNNLQMSLSLTHWLSDLSYSTMLSETSHPGNPTDYTFRSKPYSVGTGTEKPGLLSESRASDIFTPATIPEDLFGKAILPFFKKLCEEDTMLVSSRKNKSLQACLPAETKKNFLALEALNKFELDKPWCSPLSLNRGTTELCRSVSVGILKMLDDGAYYQSFWDNLIGRLSSSFMFGVVPRVDYALVAPIIPGLRQVYDCKIYDTDQDYVELNSVIPRLIRGIGVSTSLRQGTMTAHAQAPTDPTPDVGIGGCWLGVDADGKPLKRGSFLIVRAPCWLEGIGWCTVKLQDTLGVTSATTPAGGGPKADPAPADRIRENSQIFQDFAHSEYMRQVLQGRQGMVTGKLRFDIAPGSNVWIEGVSEKFIGTSDKLAENLIGMVTRVSCGLNAEQAKAATGFGISYARTEKENESPQTSTDKHPLYSSTPFKGAPLVDDYKLD